MHQDRHSQQDMRQQPKPQGVTFRAFAVGLLLVVFLCVVTPYTDLVMQTSLIACNHMPIGAITMFLVLVALVNVLLRHLPLQRPFTSAELITIYAMMLVSAGIPSFGLAAYVLPIAASPAYFGGPEHWLPKLQQFIPTWFGPTDSFAVSRYYEGLRSGEGIPWGLWIKPLLGWTVFVFALYLVMICMSAILRKQWVERERLSFPLVQLPLAMVRGEGRPGGNPFFKNWYLLIGIAIPLAIHSVNGLHSYVPSIPYMNLKAVDLTSGLAEHHPWSAARHIYLYFYFSVIGLSYMLSSEVALSLWLFHFIYKFQSVASAALGYGEEWRGSMWGQPFITYQGAGAVFAIVAAALWMARGHLSNVCKEAFGRPVSESSADEPMPYAFAFWGLVAGTLILAGWLTVAGMSFLVALALLLLFFVAMLALARFVADSGLLMVQAPFQPGEFMTSLVGSANFGAANLTILNIVQFIFMYDLRSYLMPSVMDGFRMSDGPRLRRRSLLKAMAAAIIVAVVVSYASHLIWTYKTGGVNMHPWFFRDASRGPYLRAFDHISSPTAISWSNIGFTGVGAFVACGLILLRQRYTGWPLHPIGYAMGSTFAISQMWFPIMFGWILKSLILRYGGRKLYEHYLPLFLGLILGEFGASALWILIDLAFGVKGHAIFPN